MARRARLEVGLEEVSQVVRRELARVEVVVDHLAGEPLLAQLALVRLLLDGARAEEAVDVARLGRAAGGCDLRPRAQ